MERNYRLRVHWAVGTNRMVQIGKHKGLMWTVAVGQWGSGREGTGWGSGEELQKNCRK